MQAEATKRIPRPMNSFMVFAQEYRATMRKENPSLDNKSISKMLGQVWKEMPDDKKQRYKQQAARLAEEHKTKFPDYKFVRASPRKKGVEEANSTGAEKQKRAKKAAKAPNSGTIKSSKRRRITIEKSEQRESLINGEPLPLPASKGLHGQWDNYGFHESQLQFQTSLPENIQQSVSELNMLRHINALTAEKDVSFTGLSFTPNYLPEAPPSYVGPPTFESGDSNAQPGSPISAGPAET